MYWEDYVDFNVDEIEDAVGSEALDAIRERVEASLSQLTEALEVAGSDAEREMAQAELDEFRIDTTEIESVLADFELEILTEYMSESFKDDQERIDRYLYLTGQGRFAKGAKDVPTPLWGVL